MNYSYAYIVYGLIMVTIISIVVWFVFGGRSKTEATKSPALVSTDAEAGVGDETSRRIPKTSHFWFIIIAIVIVAIITGFLFIPNETAEFFDYTINYRKLYWWILVVYVVGSIYIIKVDEVGGVTLLGYPIQSGGAGPRVVFPGIMQLYRDTAQVMQVEFPADPERIWHKDPAERKTDVFVKDKYGNDTDEQFYVLPYRITTGAPTKDSDDPLNIRATVEPSVFTRFRINENKYMSDFIPRIGSRDEAVRQINDTIAKTLQHQFCQRTVGEIVHDFQQINNDIYTQVAILVGAIQDTTSTTNKPRPHWGVDLIDVNMKVASLSKDLNVALQEVAIKKADALMTIITAEAERKRLIEEGAGNAKARELFLKGEAVGLKEIADLLEIDKNQASELFKTKAAETALKEAEGLTIFAGAGGAGMETLFGLAQSLKQS